jgi:hypothetical protein
MLTKMLIAAITLAPTAAFADARLSVSYEVNWGPPSVVVYTPPPQPVYVPPPQPVYDPAPVYVPPPQPVYEQQAQVVVYRRQPVFVPRYVDYRNHRSNKRDDCDHDRRHHGRGRHHHR